MKVEAFSNFQALSDVDVAADPLFFNLTLGDPAAPEAWSIIEPAVAQLQLICSSASGLQGTLLGGHTHQVVWSFLNHFSTAARLTPTERRVLFWKECWNLAVRRHTPVDERYKGGKALLAGIGSAYVGGLLIGLPLGFIFGELGMLAGVGGSALTGIAFALRGRKSKSSFAERALLKRLDKWSCFDDVKPLRGPQLTWEGPALVRGRDRTFEKAQLIKGRRVHATANAVGLSLELEVFRWVPPKEAHPAVSIIPPSFAIYRLHLPEGVEDLDLEELTKHDESGELIGFLDDKSLHDATLEQALSEVERLLVGKTTTHGPYR